MLRKKYRYEKLYLYWNAMKMHKTMETELRH